MDTHLIKLKAKHGPRGRLTKKAPNLDALNFGFPGIRARYDENPGMMIRCVDPFSAEIVSFAKPLQYDNWLLRRFDLHFNEVDSSGREWSALSHGHLLVVRPHLVLRGEGGAQLEMVVQTGEDLPRSELDALQDVAQAHGLRPSLRTGVQIRSQPLLLNQLDLMRRQLAMHLREVRDPRASEQLLQLLQSLRSIHRGELLRLVVTEQRLSGFSKDLLDSFLVWFRQLGQIQLDIDGGLHDDTCIEVL